jgi:type IV secretion system protein VirB11
MLAGETTLRHLLAPFLPVLAMRGVTEVVVNKPGEIGYEQDGGWHWEDCPGLDFDRLDAIGILCGQTMAQEFDPQHPICLSTLPDGQRFTACRPPVMAQGRISLTIRVPSRSVRRLEDDDFTTLVQSVNQENAPATQRSKRLMAHYKAGRWQQFFKLAVESKRTILATGATGSGKTTLLKRLMQAIPPEERLVTIEDTDEFGALPHRNRVSLFYGAAGITAEDAVQAALRMRPDRIAMQELRGAEAFAYIRALLAGHPGGLTTLHADRGEDEAFEALAVMVKQHPAGREIPDDKLRALIRRLIDVVVWCVRDKDGFQVPYVWFRDAEEGE